MHIVEDLVTGSNRLAESITVVLTLHPDADTWSPATLLAALAARHWTPEDVQAFDEEWPTASVATLGGALLRTATELACSDWTPAQVLAWLRVFFSPAPADIQLTPAARAAWRQASTPVTPGSSLEEAMRDPSAAAVAEYTAAYFAATGDRELAILAATAGLSPDEVSQRAGAGTLHLDGLRALAALRASKAVS